MINYIENSEYFASPARVLVNTVNTVGVMGKGLAKEFKRIYPEMFKEYQALCEQGKFKIGSLHLYKTPNKWILNFPTKKHWRQPSKLEYIEKGLTTFTKNYSEWRINSIAFPALGCGNGQLDFNQQVKPLMEKYLDKLPISIFIYPPKQKKYTPEHINPKEMKKWLRSEPRSLPFSEVWEDIKNVIFQENHFETLKRKSSFEVEFVNQKNEGLRILTAGTSRGIIPKEEIRDFWHQLRGYGFTISKNAPAGLERDMSYLAPIFLRLPYITEVLLYDKNNGRNPSTGLQYFEPMIKEATFREQISLPI